MKNLLEFYDYLLVLLRKLIILNQEQIDNYNSGDNFVTCIDNLKSIYFFKT